MKNLKTRTGLVALAIALPLSLAACGSSSEAATPAAGGNTPAATSSDAMTSTPSETMTSSESMDASAAVFGEGCAAVPKDGKGSFNGMATDPVATAASNNPLLSTLVAAVKAAGLVETLSGAGPFTVFAPTNAAFEKLPAGTVDTLLKPENKKMLTDVLTYHVVAGKMSAADLAKAIEAGGGSAKLTTVEGGTLTATMSGNTITLTDEKGGKSTVTQGDVMQSNGVIHVVDTVLMPA